MRKIIVLIPWYLICCVGSAGAEGTVHSSMAGNVLCGSYLKARAEHRQQPFDLWLSGYLTGLATFDKKVNDVGKLEVALGDGGTILLDSYCKVHPLDTFQVAAREMTRTVFYHKRK